jgi:hypothetical protein
LLRDTLLGYLEIASLETGRRGACLGVENLYVDQDQLGGCMEKQGLVLGEWQCGRQQQAEDSEFPHHKIITRVAARIR